MSPHRSMKSMRRLELPQERRIESTINADGVAEERVGLDAVIVNPGFMLGPWDWKPSSGRMLLEVAQGIAWLAPQGHFSVCDVRDVVAGILSVNLGVVNILPFPPLDGGRMAMLVIKRLFGSRVSLRAERITYAVGFVFLLAFVFWITGFDIVALGSR